MNHGRVFRIAIATVVLMVAVASIQVSAVDAYQVTVSCSNGADSTEFTVTVDEETLNAIKGAVEAIALYPAGLTCNLTVGAILTSLLVGTALADSGSKDFAVGGFRAPQPPGSGCAAGYIRNVAFSAHKDAAGTVKGTINQAVPADQPDPTCFPPGGLPANFKATVACLNVASTTARMRGDVTHTSGFYTSLSPGQDVYLEVIDVGNPQGGVPADQVSIDFGGDTTTCAPTTAPFQPDNGNGVVHDETSVP